MSFSGSSSVLTGYSQTSGIADAFGRLRVSSPQTVVDSKQIITNQPALWDDQQVSGAGTTSTHSAFRASSVIAVGATTAGKRVRQLFQGADYQAGKSQQVLYTMILGAGATGITREVGQYNDDNGVFLRQVDGALSLVLRSSVTGAPVDTVIPQASWDDPLDGLGRSGYTFDPATSTQMYFAYEWLSVGPVSVGVRVNNVYIEAHRFLSAGILTSAYSSSPVLPLRYSIENDGTGPAASLEYICATVVSEGGADVLGTKRYASSRDGPGAITVATSGTIYALVGLRLAPANLNLERVDLEAFSTLIEADGGGEWLAIWNPAGTGGLSWAALNPGSGLEVAYGASGGTAITVPGTGNAFIKEGGYVSGASGLLSTQTLEAAKNQNPLDQKRLGRFIDGTSEELWLAIRPLSSGAGQVASGSVTFREAA